MTTICQWHEKPKKKNLHGMPFGLSPSFQDSTAAILLNLRGAWGTNDDVVNYLNVGCPNPTIQYDAA